MLDLIMETMDFVLFPAEIDLLINDAIHMCRILKRENLLMHPANIRKLHPNASEEFCELGAEFLNAWAENM